MHDLEFKFYKSTSLKDSFKLNELVMAAEVNFDQVGRADSKKSFMIVHGGKLSYVFPKKAFTNRFKLVDDEETEFFDTTSSSDHWYCLLESPGEILERYYIKYPSNDYHVPSLRNKVK